MALLEREVMRFWVGAAGALINLQKKLYLSQASWSCELFCPCPAPYIIILYFSDVKMHIFWHWMYGVGQGQS